MQQEPSPALPPRSLRRHPRGSACFHQLFLWFFPPPGFSWRPQAAAGPRAKQMGSGHICQRDRAADGKGTPGTSGVP